MTEINIMHIYYYYNGRVVCCTNGLESINFTSEIHWGLFATMQPNSTTIDYGVWIRRAYPEIGDANFLGVHYEPLNIN